ncbi:Bifunctional apolipoprotein N-acyltransferase/polyprenol monophosphomannose synthase [Candidatus Entotheonellaceae bacterium PAL068K]
MSLPDRPQLSIIVPTFQESLNLPPLAIAISAALAQVIPAWELIVVDDDSRDATVEVCETLYAKGVPITLVIRTGERGLATAVLQGFVYARAPVLVVMDADLSHPAAAIPKLYRAITDGAEFAIGSRYTSGGSTDDRWTLYRWFNSKVASLLARPLASLSDPMSGFFALPRSLLQQCASLTPVGYKIALEILVKSRAKNIQEIPIHFRSRQYGKSKLTLGQKLLYLRHLSSLYKYLLTRRLGVYRSRHGCKR